MFFFKFNLVDHVEKVAKTNVLSDKKQGFIDLLLEMYLENK